MVVSGSAWSSFQFRNGFAVVPVVVVLPSSVGDEPAAIRVRAVSQTGFEATIAEPYGEDGVHSDMEVSFIAVTPGVRELGSSGLWLEAGFLSTNRVQAGSNCLLTGLTRSWASLSFKHSFASRPSLLAQVQSVHNEQQNVAQQNSQPWLTVAVNNLAASGASIALELAETSQHGVVAQNEDIGYIALEQGNGIFQDLSTGSDVKVAAVVSPRAVKGWGNGPVGVTFGGDLGTSPLIVASQSSRKGGDGGWVRLDVVQNPPSATQAFFVVDEDQACNDERNHVAEEVSVVAFSQSASIAESA